MSAAPTMLQLAARKQSLAFMRQNDNDELRRNLSWVALGLAVTTVNCVRIHEDDEELVILGTCQSD
jgi:hypothetical protein